MLADTGKTAYQHIECTDTGILHGIYIGREERQPPSPEREEETRRQGPSEEAWLGAPFTRRGRKRESETGRQQDTPYRRSSPGMVTENGTCNERSKM